MEMKIKAATSLALGASASCGYTAGPTVEETHSIFVKKIDEWVVLQIELGDIFNSTQTIGSGLTLEEAIEDAKSCGWYF